LKGMQQTWTPPILIAVQVQLSHLLGGGSLIGITASHVAAGDLS